MEKAKFIISRKNVLEQYEKAKQICDIVSYSSKTNPIITKILEEKTKDCMFSIHTLDELVNVKDKSRVMFLAQGWNTDEIKELANQGIRWFVVDNEKDLDEFLLFLQKNNVKVNLLLRVKLKELTLKTEKYFVFGMNSDAVCKKIQEIRKNPMLKEKIESLGVHFHRKTQNMAEWNLKYEFEEMFEKTLKSIDYVCIGGGIPSEYANTNAKVIESIFSKIKDFKSFLKEKNIKIMLEPGRFIAAPSGKLITKIKRIYDNNIILNSSVYSGDMDALIVPVKLLVEGEISKEESEKFKAKPYVIKGITPCSMDLYRYKVYLPPQKVKEGEEIVFLNAGAYNFSTDFLNLEKLETVVV